MLSKMFKYNKTKNGFTRLNSCKANLTGFTILEVLVTILVITIGGLATYAMVQQIIFSTLSSSYRFSAAYLAKEGIENVRNIRDTNWLQEAPNWYDGLIGDSGLQAVPGFPNYERRTIVTFNDPKLEVKVEVQWDIRGNDGTITVEENLYDWY